MRSPFTSSEGLTGPRRTRRTSQRSFVLGLCVRLLLIVLAVVMATPAGPDEFQSTAPFAWAWNSGEGDVDDEVANADSTPFADTLFQQDHQLVVALVRSKHFGECVALDRDSDAHTRVRTRAPPHRADEVVIIFPAPAVHSDLSFRESCLPPPHHLADCVVPGEGRGHGAA